MYHPPLACLPKRNLFEDTLSQAAVKELNVTRRLPEVHRNVYLPPRASRFRFFISGLSLRKFANSNRTGVINIRNLGG